MPKMKPVAAATAVVPRAGAVGEREPFRPRLVGAGPERLDPIDTGDPPAAAGASGATLGT